MNRIERERERHELMTFTEALTYFRVSNKTLLKALHSGDVTGMKIGAQWRIMRPINESIEKKKIGAK